MSFIELSVGGRGHDALEKFYADNFIPKMPPDVELVPISRTIGSDQVVDEMVFRFTHTVVMDWMLPGIAPTGKHVEQHRFDQGHSDPRAGVHRLSVLPLSCSGRFTSSGNPRMRSVWWALGDSNPGPTD